jgi:hypothetical protein
MWVGICFGAVLLLVVTICGLHYCKRNGKYATTQQNGIHNQYHVQSSSKAYNSDYNF